LFAVSRYCFPYAYFVDGGGDRLKISVIAPVKNEFPWLGYSILSAEPFVHEFIYTVASDSDDGTIELLHYLKPKLGDKLKFHISSKYAFDPLDMPLYNQSYNDAIAEAEGDAIFFLHPDMLITKGAELKEGPLAWCTSVTSFAGDFHTKIASGRGDRWKNIHANKFGLHYYGAYGSHNEDFYFSDITGNAYKHHDDQFEKYPFEVRDSGISINHYCELKSYRRRLEKMKLCMKTQHPSFDDRVIEQMASYHPRVILDPGNEKFGKFEFVPSSEPVPDVIKEHKEEFESILKREVLSNG
jgi:glycosyltransferase involved in cell wall biosynthesis